MYAVGKLVLAVGAAVVGLLREGLALSEPSEGPDDRPIQDADLIGEYNFRTQRFDSGTDPAGWYEDET
jgi:hypothetical protein